MNWNKVRGTPSAVQISATIAAFAKLSINKFKNLNNNPCIYSDTDSVVLEKELPLNSLLNNKNKDNGIKLGKVEKYNLEPDGFFGS